MIKELAGKLRILRNEKLHNMSSTLYTIVCILIANPENGCYPKYLLNVSALTTLQCEKQNFSSKLWMAFEQRCWECFTVLFNADLTKQYAYTVGSWSPSWESRYCLLNCVAVGFASRCCNYHWHSMDSLFIVHEDYSRRDVTGRVVNGFSRQEGLVTARHLSVMILIPQTWSTQCVKWRGFWRYRLAERNSNIFISATCRLHILLSWKCP